MTELKDIFDDTVAELESKPTTSFSSEPEKSKPGQKKYIRKETIIDKFNVKRQRVELAPTMCTKPHCGFDIAKHNNVDFNRLPAQRKEDLLEALKVHIETAHSVSEDIIITEDLMPSKWLGSKEKVF